MTFLVNEGVKATVTGDFSHSTVMKLLAAVERLNGWRDSHSSSIHHSTRLSWIWNSHSAPSLCEIRRSARMRNLTALLLLLSLSSLYLVSSAPAALDYKEKCCSSLSKVKKIPVQNIVSFQRTGSSCPLQAVIFETKAKRKFCFDPTADWVKNYMKKHLTKSLKPNTH
ncbi:C-C motif chemokine 8-like [Clarias gariepinus]|uniref:C-C motif chemokine 8-like n=1 Tax=Clarias gariepinus TaxID=13013 RepID=UPI00234D9417|nr:C-C motif chemokine 8-like [Clarias gariepinus]